jgi:NAD(P)-dependent dehydrogenase (short-subunit alcohol dehydrogenase family)
MGPTFRRVSAGRYELRPECRADYDRLISALHDVGWRPERLVHLWSVTGDTVPTDGAGLQELGFYSILYLAQALEKQEFGSPMDLSVVSTGIHDVTGHEVVQPEKAMVLGPCKVIPQEYRQVRCRSVDVQLGQRDEPIPSELVERLVEELSGPLEETVVAFRGNHRWIQVFDPVRLEPGASAWSRVRHGGVYLITGGFGGVGLALAESLARTVRAKLILIGRMALPPRNEWEAWLTDQDRSSAVRVRIQAIQRLEALGAEVLPASADVADVRQMQAVMAEGHARFGQVQGVIHAAAASNVEATRALVDTTQEVCERVFRPKILGLRVLEQLLTGHRLDFCLVTSSLASVLGGLGLTAYAAANLFLDAVASRRQPTHALSWTSVNWDAWQLNNDKPTDGCHIQRREGMEVFQRILLSSRGPQIVVSPVDLSERMDDWIRLTGRDATEAPGVSDERAATAPDGVLEQTLAAMWRDALGTAEIRADDNFFNLGGHSLLIIQILTRVRNALHVNLSPADLFEKPTLATFTELVRQHITQQHRPVHISQLVEQVNRLSEEDARAVLEAKKARSGMMNDPEHRPPPQRASPEKP